MRSARDSQPDCSIHRKERVIACLRSRPLPELAGGYFEPRWFPERLYRDAVVSHFQDSQTFSAARRFKNNFVPFCRSHQGSPKGGCPTNVIALEIDFIRADYARHSLCACGVQIAHGGSKERLYGPLPCSGSFRIYYFCYFDSLRQKANPSIDLPQPSLTVLVVGVLTAIAIARSPGHHLHHGRAILVEQEEALISEALQSAWSDVINAVVRGGFLCFRPSRKSFTQAPASLDAMGNSAMNLVPQLADISTTGGGWLISLERCY
jgi:hypothetical protein